MDQLLAYLEDYKPKPLYAQIAIGGNWEEAVRIDIGETINFTTLLSSIDDPSVAFEIFYRLSDERIVFLGLRYSPLMKSVSSPEEFLLKFQEVLELVPNNNIRTIFAELGQALDGDPNVFLANEPSYVEIGVVDYWKSLGSLILRRHGEPTLTEESLRILMAQNKTLLHNQKNHVSLDFAFNNPQYWIAIQTSTLRDKEYVTDLSLLTRLVNML